jgi:hypothetical protein
MSDLHKKPLKSIGIPAFQQLAKVDPSVDSFLAIINIESTPGELDRRYSVCFPHYIKKGIGSRINSKNRSPCA